MIQYLAQIEEALRTVNEAQDFEALKAPLILVLELLRDREEAYAGWAG